MLASAEETHGWITGNLKILGKIGKMLATSDRARKCKKAIMLSDDIGMLHYAYCETPIDKVHRQKFREPVFGG